MTDKVALSHFPHVLCGIYSVRVGAQRVKRLVCRLNCITVSIVYVVLSGLWYWVMKSGSNY